MSFELLGFAHPMGNGYDAGAVAPVGRLDGTLVVVTYGTKDDAIHMGPLATTARYCHLTSVQHRKLAGFNVETEQLYNLGRNKIVRYTRSEQAAFFRSLLDDTRFSQGNPFVRYGLALCTGESARVWKEVRRCKRKLTSAPVRTKFVERTLEDMRKHGMTP